MQDNCLFRSFNMQEQLPDYADCSLQPTEILPIIPLSAPSTSSLLVPSLPAHTEEITIADPAHNDENAGNDGQTIHGKITPAEPAGVRKKKILRKIILTLGLLLIVTLCLIWHTLTPSYASPVITQQNLSNTTSAQSTDNSADNISGDAIQVYVLGAVVRPGVYTLPGDARVYQLIQAAGGPLPDADLVSLNLAAKLTDGQEVYVLKKGETSPVTLNTTASSSPTTANSSQTVNINTATATTMEQVLHVSSTTAQKIIAYRTQHGPFTSIEQLQQAISKSIYQRIENMVTV